MCLFRPTHIDVTKICLAESGGLGLKGCVKMAEGRMPYTRRKMEPKEKGEKIRCPAKPGGQETFLRQIIGKGGVGGHRGKIGPFECPSIVKDNAPRAWCCLREIISTGEVLIKKGANKSGKSL